MFHKHADRICGGVQVHVTDREAFRPLRAGVALLRVVWRRWERRRWRTEPYEFVSDRPAIDLLAGGAWLRRGIEAGEGLDELCGPWAEAEAAFTERRRTIFLYP